MVLKRRPVRAIRQLYSRARASQCGPQRWRRIAALAALLMMIGTTPAPAQTEEPDAGRTPPRLSFMNGEVSFWRPGAEDWTPAHLNTPLAPGDTLYAGPGANLELQIGPSAFVRAGEATQIGIENQDPSFLQLKVTSGHAALDARALMPGQSIEVDTPTAAFNVDSPGYYRIEVGADATTFIARRGGHARVTPSGGEATAVGPDEQVSVEGTETPRVTSSAAPDLDDWDRWNNDRTDHVTTADSSRDVPRGVYGADDLDRYGTWRPTPRYGRVWVPSSEPAGWAPYSTGRWIWDPSYGWTWVDDAPWGWAPYHYGRWVYTDGFWGWTPGPVIAAPVYAPALVAFFGFPGVHVGIGFGVPSVGWVALGFGEPCIPWWGHGGFVGHPWWGGWGGPHVVNNVVINNTTIVNVNNINVFQNARAPHAVVAVRGDHFGRAAVQQARLAQVDAHRLQPVRGRVPVNPSAHSLVAGTGPARRPPGEVASRAVVATRSPHDPRAQLHAAGLRPTTSAASAAQVRLVSPRSQQARGTGRPETSLPARAEGTQPRIAPPGVPPHPGLVERGAGTGQLGRPAGLQSSTRPAAVEAAPRPAGAAAAGPAPARASSSRFTPPPPPSAANAQRDGSAANAVHAPRETLPHVDHPPAARSTGRFAAPGGVSARRAQPPPPPHSEGAGRRGPTARLSESAASRVQSPARMEAPRRPAPAPAAPSVAREVPSRPPAGNRVAQQPWPARPNTAERPRPQPVPNLREAPAPAARPEMRAAAPRPQTYGAPSHPSARMSAPQRQPAAPVAHAGGADGGSKNRER
jgi:uncharacterized protein DUF6600